MDAAVATCEHRLLNDFQHGFPLHPRPFAELGRRLGLPEQHVLDALSQLKQEGKISRIGAVLSPNRFGASTLAAMRVPPEMLEEVAHRINRFPEVNHNYAREHRFNLWFVVTAASQADLRTALRKIEDEAGYALLSLPLVEAFHIDLGFPLSGVLTDNNAQARSSAETRDANEAEPVGEDDKRLIAALQDGLPLEARPFRRLAEQTAMTEQEVIARLRHWQEQGDIRRFGVIVRHRALGYAANAMLVHEVPDAEVGQIGGMLARDPGITLCYRRARVLPEWPYNLFCMIHGRERAEVTEYVARLRERYGLLHLPHEVLFSSRCFKQTGARYA